MASSSSSTPHSFFKIIIRPILIQQKLEVPKKFVIKNGEALESKEVWLKVANGGMWKVGIKKSNEKVWFEKGWEEFVKFYSIDVGFLLTFRYEGNFCFYVVIYDHSATEIEYSIMSKGKNKKIEREEFGTLGNNNNNVPQNLNSQINMRMTRRNQVDSNKVNQLKKDEDLKKPQKLRNKGIMTSTPTKEAIFMSTEKASKLETQTTNPFFMIKLNPSHLHTASSYPNIPRWFGNTYMKHIKHFIVRVSNDHEKAWKILCVERWSNGTQRFEINSGWKEFSRENGLKEGDVCVFELLSNTQIISFKATIFRLGFCEVV